jgi:meso-butanediol dehydrogenase/(S,S)-butanediol dehydrogenase/diacetyl reductase
MARLDGKRVLITGTAGGQGEAAQRLFASEGATVIGCDIQDGAAETTAEALRQEGLDVRGQTVDLADPDAARVWVEAGVQALGGIDVLYNNAAGFGFAPFAEMTIDLFRHVLRVELEIVFNTTHPAWVAMRRGGGGSVINTASVSALRGSAPHGCVAHSAAKAGVTGMTRALAAEGAARGIRVNAISPGFVQSPATEAAIDSELQDWILSSNLIQRPATVEEVAFLALYLASDESAFVTGQDFIIDGGYTAGFRKKDEG